MNVRRSSFLLVLLVVGVGAGCASSATQSSGYGAVSGFDDCASLYPPVTSGFGYANQYYPSNYEDGLCSAYPRVEGYYPEYVVQKPSRQVTAAEGREHRAHRVTRPGDSGSGWGSGSYDSSSSGSSGSSGGGATVPRMEPIPVNSPPPASPSNPGTVTIQPREH